MGPSTVSGTSENECLLTKNSYLEIDSDRMKIESGFLAFWHCYMKPTLAFYVKLIVVLKRCMDEVDWLGINEIFLHERKIALLFLRRNGVLRVFKWEH